MSMTGFAQTSISLQSKAGTQTHITIMLKSLNARYFECSPKMPYQLMHLESSILKELKKRLARGTIMLHIQSSNQAFFKSDMQADVSLAKSYIEAVDVIVQETDVSGALTVHDILQLPNVFYTQDQPLEKKQEEAIRKAIWQLIDQIVKVRAQEGKSLEQDLHNRLEKIAQEAPIIQELNNLYMDETKEMVQTKLGLTDILPDQVSDAQRAVYYLELDKRDIHEEIVRINNHIQAFQECLHADYLEKGRRLDFILQELAREANTIAAKSTNADMSSHAINIKVEVEKAREQVQNIV